MKLKTLVLILKTSEKVKEDASKLRGYIANKYKEYPILHHHIEEAGYLYTYPRIQYKILEGTPVILGIEEGAEVLKKISADITELKLGKNAYKVESIQMTHLNAEFGPCRENHHYKFVTHWLALNPSNYERYKGITDWKEKKEFLNGILVGNILSMCKSLDYVVTSKLYVHSRLDEENVVYKAIPLIGFTGEFRGNFQIPDFFGLGKGVSQGFGVVKDARQQIQSDNTGKGAKGKIYQGVMPNYLRENATDRNRGKACSE
ncbi:MAG: CRISPR-associated endonuclease Cas6 [Halobacteriota archaeon]